MLRVAQVRLRFLFVLLAAFLIVGKWHVLRNYWDTLTMPSPSKMLSGGINGETEYFCPMCPGVISGWPTKCSVCNMPLVRRKKGGAQQLPDGVLARMQISPYRVHLAGIQTAPVEYRPLAREVVARGMVAKEASGAGEDASGATGLDDAVATITAEIDQREIPFVTAGATATVVADGELAGEPREGRVTQVAPKVSPQTHRVHVELAAANPRGELWPGMQVTVQIRRPICELEPFRSLPADPPPPAEGELRKLYICHEHPSLLREKSGRCPEDNNLLMDLPLADLQRVAWWCPMHPDVTASEPDKVCEACNGMRLVPRIVQYRPPGQVLAVPESAVIDLGDRRVAYVEQMPGMFDALEVVVGPRCDGYYPVVRGLLPDQRVAATGAFLLDAETRLNPSVAAGYFGASLASASSAGPSTTAAAPSGKEPSAKEAAAIRAALDKLSSDDRASAERQKHCPITGMPLGSMGAPVKINLKAHTVWLCCAGCEAEASEQPHKTLEKLKQRSR
ncbi:MAG TPA: heavy metal-binding domain-containing protein [Pirellulales bacterium]|nr:heavy metal-binding domain-containing protein [Pirellulales bacterium]